MGKINIEHQEKISQRTGNIKNLYCQRTKTLQMKEIALMMELSWTLTYCIRLMKEGGKFWVGQKLHSYGQRNTLHEEGKKQRMEINPRQFIKLKSISNHVLESLLSIFTRGVL